MMEEVLDEQPEILEKLECSAASAQIAHQLQEAAQTDVISSGANGNGSSVSPMLSSVSSSLSSSFTDGSTIFPTSHECPTSLIPTLGTPSITVGNTSVTETSKADTTMSLSSATITTSPAPDPDKNIISGLIETPVIPRAEMIPLSPSNTSESANSLFGWFSTSSFVSRVMEKTKSSVETMITTLDPQMKEYIKSGGDINIIVASTKEVKIGPVREAMQQTFGHATVTGKASDTSTAAQPVGYAAALRGAEERISRLRQQDEVCEKQTIVAIEGFIVELQADRWFEMSCLLLQDPVNQITVTTYSQPTPIPTAYVLTAQDRTPSDYPLRWSGLAVTIGQVVEEAQPHIGRANWQQALAGVSRVQSLTLASQGLAYLYKQQFPTSYIS